MSDAISIEIGGTLDPKFIAAFKTLNNWVTKTETGLGALQKAIQSLEKTTSTAGKSLAAYQKSLSSLGRGVVGAAKKINDLTDARTRDNAASKQSVSAANRESAAQRKVAASLAARAKAMDGLAKKKIPQIPVPKLPVNNNPKPGSSGGKQSGGVRGWLEQRANSSGFPIGSAAIGGGITASVMESTGFNYRNQLIANTGNLSDKDRDNMARQIKELSGKDRTNQTTKELQSALEVYVSAGLDPLREGVAALEATGKVATGYGIDIRDIATTNAAAMSNMGIKPEQLKQFLDINSAAGKVGQFEMKDLAANFGAISANAAEYNLQGLEGAKYLAGLLQAIRVSSANAAEAYTNFDNLRSKIDAPETSKAFEEKLGFDMPAYIKSVRESGGNVMAAFVNKTRELTGGKIDEVSKIATDSQFRKGLMAAMNNTEKFDAAIKAANNSAGEFERDFVRTMKTSQEQLKSGKIAVLNMASEIGDTLTPAVGSLLNEFRPLAYQLSNFISQNPEAVATTIKVAAAITALNLAIGPAVKLFQTGRIAISGFTAALKYVTSAAASAGLPIGTALGQGINDGTKGRMATFFGPGGGFANILMSAVVIAGATAAGYAMGTAIGNGVAEGLKDSSNAALNNGAAILADTKAGSMADKIAAINSANPEDRKAALEFLTKNPLARQGINAAIAGADAEKAKLQTQLDAANANKPSGWDVFNAKSNDFNNSIGLGWMTSDSEQAKYADIIKRNNAPGNLQGAIDGIDKSKSALESALKTLDYSDALKAKDPTAIQKAEEAARKLKDDADKRAAGLPSALTPAERKSYRVIENLNIEINGVSAMSPEDISGEIVARIKDAMGEKESNDAHKERTVQDNATTVY